MREMKLNTAYAIGFFIGGGLMFLNGLFGFVPMTRTTLILQTIIVIAFFLCITFVMLCKKEKGDEMSRQHFHTACFYGAIVLIIGITSIDLLRFYLSTDIMDNFHQFFFALGLGVLTSGIIYFYAEKRG